MNSLVEHEFWKFWREYHPEGIVPLHFEAYVADVLSAGPERRVVYASPPQHGWTTLTLALIALPKALRRLKIVTFQRVAERARKTSYQRHYDA